MLIQRSKIANLPACFFYLCVTFEILVTVFVNYWKKNVAEHECMCVGGLARACIRAGVLYIITQKMALLCKREKLLF
jgi:hypothetical protein